LTDAPRECYIEFDTPDLSDEQWSAFEAAVNAAVRSALPTKVHVFNSLEEAKSSELVMRSKGIPADLKGPLRSVAVAAAHNPPHLISCLLLCCAVLCCAVLCCAVV
jgi:hypothetical protein